VNGFTANYTNNRELVTVPAEEVMPKFYKGKLHSGSKSGPIVTSISQAKAIASSEKQNEDRRKTMSKYRKQSKT